MLEKIVEVGKLVSFGLILSYNFGCVPSKYYKNNKLEVNPCSYSEQVYDKSRGTCEFIFHEIPIQPRD